MNKEQQDLEMIYENIQDAFKPKTAEEIKNPGQPPAQRRTVRVDAPPLSRTTTSLIEFLGKVDQDALLKELVELYKDGRLSHTVSALDQQLKGIQNLIDRVVAGEASAYR